MERRLKERLTGTGVLVLLAVIFVPLLLDDTQQAETKITTTNIPEKPDAEFSSRLIPMPERGEILPIESDPGETGNGSAVTQPDAGQSTEEAVVASGASRATPASPGAGVGAETDDKGLTGWVVQVGSFSRENADKLDDKLRAAGYRSYVVDEPVKGKDGSSLYRVRIGPEILRSETLKLKAKLKKEMKLDGIVLNYP